MRKLFPIALPLAALALQLACTQPAPPVNVFHLGEKAQAGPLIYTVLEVRWRAQIGDGPLARVPERRFLIVHLSVTNSGAQEITLPSLTLTDETNQSFNETMDGRAIPYWLGLIRKLKPAETLDGSILFDVEPKSFKLRLDDGAGNTNSLVELPLQFDAGQTIIPSPIESPTHR